MNTKLVIGLVVLLVIIIVGIVYYKSVKKSVIESMADVNNSFACQGAFPEKPNTIPYSTYAQLVQPFIETSDSNPPIEPTIVLNDNNQLIVDDKSVCKTPSEAFCTNNDLCARYGIGESCQGPEGYGRCVCEVRKVDGKIGIDGVCTSDDQCCTNYCYGGSGLQSKFCSCPEDKQWDPVEGKCVAVVENVIYSPVLAPKGVCLREGNRVEGLSCSKDTDCGLGAACNGTGYCVCLLSTQGDYIENKIKLGGLCESSDQCLPNLLCEKNQYGDKTCLCPKGLLYDWTTNWCDCPTPGDVYLADREMCFPPNNVPRKTCPNKGAYCKNDTDVGLGESCDPVSHVAVCHAKDLPYSQFIFGPGKCNDNSDCVSNQCLKSNNGFSYCYEEKLMNGTYSS